MGNFAYAAVESSIPPNEFVALWNQRGPLLAQAVNQRQRSLGSFYGPDYVTGNGVTDDKAKLNALVNTTMQPSGGQVDIIGTVLIGSNITFPANVTLNFPPGVSKLKTANGTVTVTIAGDVIAGPYKVFDCSSGGSVTFASTSNGLASPIWWGADPTYANDSTTAFQKWGLCGASRRFVPRGQFDVRGSVTLTGQGRLEMRGVGRDSSIYFNPPADSTPLFVRADGDNDVYGNFQVHQQNARPGCTALDFANASMSQLTLDRMFVDGFTGFGLKLDSCQHLIVRGGLLTNMRAPSGSPAEAIRCTTFLNHGEFDNVRFGTNDKIARIVSGNAVTFRNCSSEEDGSLSTVTLNSMIEMSDGSASFLWDGGYVEAPRVAAGSAFFKFTDAGHKSPCIRNLTFDGSIGGVTYTDRLVDFGSARGSKLDNSSLAEVLSTFVANTSSFPTRAHNNSFTDGGVALTTHNGVMALVSGLVELNNYSVKTSLDVPSIAAGAQYESADIAVTGAAFGDHITVDSEDVSIAGLTISAYVRTAGQVRMVFFNGTAGAIDLALSDWLLKLTKMDNG